MVMTLWSTYCYCICGSWYWTVYSDCAIVITTVETNAVFINTLKQHVVVFSADDVSK